MSCGLDRYEYVVDRIIAGFNYALKELTQYFGDWAFPILVVLTLPVALLFSWSTYILVPRFVQWYYDETISEKARERYRKQGLAFLGFRRSTVVASVIVGIIFLRP